MVGHRTHIDGGKGDYRLRRAGRPDEFDLGAVYHFPGAPESMTLVAFEVADNEFGCENAVAHEASKLFLSP